MSELCILLQAIFLCVTLLAYQGRGVQLCHTIQEKNDSLVLRPSKRYPTSLAPNIVKKFTSGQGPNSADTRYYAAHVSPSRGSGNGYYGLHVVMDVYGHELKRGQYSSAEIWVVHTGDGTRSTDNTIEAGWHIYPEYYGDSHPHLFATWTRDGHQKTGCYNMDCPGFVRASGATVSLGSIIQPVSGIDRGLQNITLKVFKEKTTGEWWLYYGFNSVPTALGYFPSTLFNYLSEKANAFSFGGFVDAQRAFPSAPMGSGAQPNGGQGRAASFTNLKLIDQDGKSNPMTTNLPSKVDNNQCYSITPIANGECFYGGHGGCPE